MLRFWFHILPSQDGKRRCESPCKVGQSTRGKVTQQGSNLNQKSLFFYQFYQRESIQSYCELCGLFNPTALSTLLLTMFLVFCAETHPNQKLKKMVPGIHIHVKLYTKGSSSWNVKPMIISTEP